MDTGGQELSSGINKQCGSLWWTVDTCSRVYNRCESSEIDIVQTFKLTSTDIIAQLTQSSTNVIPGRETGTVNKKATSNLFIQPRKLPTNSSDPFPKI